MSALAVQKGVFPIRIYLLVILTICAVFVTGCGLTSGGYSAGSDRGQVTDAGVVAAEADAAVAEASGHGSESDATSAPSEDEAAADSRQRVEYTIAGWSFDNADGNLVTTRNYQIYTTLQSESFLELLPQFMQDAVEHYTTAFGDLPQPETIMTTYLFRERGQWETKTRELLPRQHETYLQLGRGGYTTQGTAILYLIDRWGYRDTLAIAAHEGWHQYTQTVFQDQLPIWLEEGIATYMEGFVRERSSGRITFRPWANTERYYALLSAVQSDALIPLHDLLDYSPQHFLESGRSKLLIYYAQVWALAHFLVEGEEGRYQTGLHDALRDAAEGRLYQNVASAAGDRGGPRRGAPRLGRTGMWLVPIYFNRDTNAFEDEYLRFIEEITSRERQRSVRRGISPLQSGQ